MTEALITGFDSAWTPGNRGAIAHCRVSGGRATFIPPVLASFDQALESFRAHEQGTGVQVFGIDQPLIVPNAIGSRPVEGAFRPLLGRMRAAIQPSSRARAEMFGDNAPIWPFLRDLSADLAWERSIGAARGRYALEIYPCAALLGLFPEFMARGRAAKYNPARRRTFNRDDWNQVCHRIGQEGDTLQIDGLSAWAHSHAALPLLRKTDQDCLDAAICVVITMHWWRSGLTRCLVVGDLTTGYIVTPTNPDMTDALILAATLRGVPVTCESGSLAGSTVQPAH